MARRKTGSQGCCLTQSSVAVLDVSRSSVRSQFLDMLVWFWVVANSWELADVCRGLTTLWCAVLPLLCACVTLCFRA